MSHSKSKDSEAKLFFEINNCELDASPITFNGYNEEDFLKNFSEAFNKYYKFYKV